MGHFEGFITGYVYKSVAKTVICHVEVERSRCMPANAVCPRTTVQSVIPIRVIPPSKCDQAQISRSLASSSCTTHRVTSIASGDTGRAVLIRRQMTLGLTASSRVEGSFSVIKNGWYVYKRSRLFAVMHEVGRRIENLVLSFRR